MTAASCPSSLAFAINARSVSRIPVTLLTGLPGSGKTSALRAWLERHTALSTLVIASDYSSLALEHPLMALYRETGQDHNAGCLCCAPQSDLARTLREAPWRFARAGVRQFEQIVVETGGTADPTGFAQWLADDTRLSRLYQLAGVGVTRDARLHRADPDTAALAHRQLAAADTILLTHDDQVSPDVLAHTVQQLHAQYPAARVQRAPRGVSAADWF